MAIFGKRGSAVLDAPEESHVLETEWTVPEPAPPGTLHHNREETSIPSLVERGHEEAWPAQRAGGYRVRIGVPSTMAGRVAMAAGVLFAVGVLGAALLAARYSETHDERFTLGATSAIEIEGNHHLTRPEIVSIFNSDMHHNIFQVPLDDRQVDLERLPWAEHATVMRLLPNRIRVQISERTPVAFVRQGGQIGLVDDGGVLLDMPQDTAGNPQYSFPVLTGISAKDPISMRAARMQMYRQFMQELDGSGEKLTQNLSEVDVSDPEDVKALVASGSTDILVHFGEENFLKRFRLFQQNLPAWKAQYPKLAAVDTRYEHQLVLEMAEGTNAPLAEAKAATVPAEPTAVVKHTSGKTSGKTVLNRSSSNHNASVHHAVKP